MPNFRLQSKDATRAALAAAILFASPAADASPLAAGVLAHYIALQAVATNRPVTRCADDNTAGTLRTVVAGAADGDIIDMSGLPDADPACTTSTITLVQGEIATSRNLTLLGPSAATLTIAAGGQNRVLRSSGAYLQITALTIYGGRNYTDGGGGCIQAMGEVRLDRATITGCIAYTPGNNSTPKAAVGGGIYAHGVSMTGGSRVSDNIVKKGSAKAYLYGAGVFSSTDVACTDSTLVGNISYGKGGGIAAAGQVTLNRCTLEANSAKYGGGIAMLNGTGQLKVDQSTISGNAGLFFGGIVSPSPATIANSTIAFNRSSSNNYGGGIMMISASLTLLSSIVARNRNGNGIAADVSLTSGAINGADNLIESSTGAAPGVIVSMSDPRLAPLGNHGGLTRTHALLAGSPAIDLGNNNSAFATDQRGAGFAREVPSGAPDIGAYERQLDDDEIFGNGFD